MPETSPLSITLPPLRITLNNEKQVNLEWLMQNLPLLENGKNGDANPPKKPELPTETRRWIATNKLLNVADDDIIKALEPTGCDMQLVREELSLIYSHPYYQSGNEFLQLLRKLESHYTIADQLASLSPKYGSIERRSSISRDFFLENYYSKNTPVIITNIMDDWDALRLWTTDHLKEKYGHAPVQIQANRNSDPEYEINVEKHRKDVTFSEYIDLITQVGETNDYYMVANNHTLEKEEFKDLLKDFTIFPEYLDPNNYHARMFFWFGPAGTVTPLHHDPVNILLAQVKGRKLVKLISTNQTPLMYNHVGVFSKVDLDNPDYDKYPLFRKVKIIETILEPGEVLFLPVGWWHYVRSLDISISVSFTNFVFPNYYEWNYPHIGR